jgi:hypothetical protein
MGDISGAMKLYQRDLQDLASFRILYELVCWDMRQEAGAAFFLLWSFGVVNVTTLTSQVMYAPGLLNTPLIYKILQPC